MSLLTAAGFKKLKRSNMRLNKKSGGAFDIHNNNDFIKPHGLKIKTKPMSKEQRKVLSDKIRKYDSAESRRLATTALLTVTISTGLILLVNQIANSL